MKKKVNKRRQFLMSRVKQRDKQGEFAETAGGCAE